MNRILLIGDDARPGALDPASLAGNGLHVGLERDPARALQRILSDAPDLVLLDSGLGSADGLDLCRALRPHYAGVLCLFSTEVDEVDQILGLELGADDYIVKPLHPRLLLARIRAHLRRSPAPGVRKLEPAAGLAVDTSSRDVRVAGRSVRLTTAEFDLLALLARHAGRILDRDSITRSLRGVAFDGLDRSIDARISRLRRKLGDDPHQPLLIKTIRGQGYLLPKAPA